MVHPALPVPREWITVHVSELRRLFNLMDASPFREQDLDPGAEEFIVGWAREAPRGRALGLRIHLDRAAAPPPIDEAGALREAIHGYFSHRAKASRARLRQTFRVGRVSLLVGCAFLVAALVLGDLAAGAIPVHHVGELVQQGLVICGWVAMWRPLEIFLYDWWPISGEARLFDRLAAMPVEIENKRVASDDEGWRRDWPTVATHPAVKG